MSTIKHFTDLEVWQKSHALFLDLVADVDKFPRRRAAAILTDQVLRSAGSIGGNIAEGFNRSKAKFLSALDIALGESNETENWLYKVRDANFLDTETANARIEQTKIISRMLISLIHSIESKPNLSRSDRKP